MHNSIADSIFDKITDSSTTKEVWNILKVVYQGNDTMKTFKLHTLRAWLETLKMIDIENVDQFMTRVMGVVNQIKLIGETIRDQKIVEKLLRSVPKKYDMIVTTILESKYFTSF